MKTGSLVSLPELGKRLLELSTLKHDLIADTRKTSFVLDGERKPLLFVNDTNGGTFPIRPMTHRHVSTYLKIPADYYDRMIEKQPELLVSNVNTWFGSMQDRRMVRTLAGDARAILSPSYQRIEHEEIARVVLPIIMALPGVQIVSCEITERRLYIHFVVPTIQGEVKRGDIVQVGGIISNSETGDGAVSVSGLIWRLMCLNGLKTSDAYRRAHIGAKQAELEQVWADDTRRADDNAVLLKVRDMVTSIVDETNFRKNLAKLQDLNNGTITGNPEKATEVLAKKLAFTEGEKGGFLRSLIEGGDLSRWGIVNAVTHQAHSATSYDRAVEFEALGGKLVDLPKSEWQEILEAA